MDNTKYTQYHYKDEYGQLLFTKTRIEPSPDGQSKSFCFEHEENGQSIKNLDGCRKTLYRLPELLDGIAKGKTIFLVEGEKDVDNLLAYGLIASTARTTFEWSEEFTQLLRDADVVILYDNDKAGLKRRDLIANSLYGKVKKLRVVDLPGIEYSESHGKDISDWFEISGNSIEQLMVIVEQTPDYMPSFLTNNTSVETEKLHTVSVDELLSLDLPPREMLLEPFLPTQGLVMIVAKRGVGKTHIALGIAYAVASGGTFLKWTAPQPKKVLYIDGEMPAVLMKERLLIISTMGLPKPASEFLQLLTPDLQSSRMPDLSQKAGRDAIESLLENIDLVVIDNISCLFRSGSENESDSWQEAQEWALDLRKKGKSVLFVHHAGKSGNQRGTSKREDILDSVIILKHPDDYKSEEGARIEIIFDKSRHFSGEDTRSFQAHLKTDDNSIWRWELSDAPKEEQIIQMAFLKRKGLTIKEIMKETGLTKSQIEYRTEKAKEKGFITKQLQIS